MKFYLLDDDKHVRMILKQIITDRELGTVCGSGSNGHEGLEDVFDLAPDIIIVDLLMPEMDGITFVEQAKAKLPDTAFVMLSQVSSKEMISAAYESGIEFFIQKPINSIEVENVIHKVRQNLSMKRTLQKMQELFTEDIPGTIPEDPGSPVTEQSRENQVISSLSESLSTLQTILKKLGIAGDIGSRDIITVVEYMIQNHAEISDLTLNDLCSHFSDTPKSMEQRIRRAASAGLVNLAHLGLEDYGNEIFTEYSNTLYNFEQVRREMDFIRGKSDRHGNVKIKNFLNALVAYSVHK